MQQERGVGLTLRIQPLATVLMREMHVLSRRVVRLRVFRRQEEQEVQGMEDLEEQVHQVLLVVARMVIKIILSFLALRRVMQQMLLGEPGEVCLPLILEH